ncbi:hypothetical protein MPER_12482 [Moniliophthora perniciosa FA553]|nr:hypothetical protein MPER_12482 [Moniliophthora perniciosa FA553]
MTCTITTGDLRPNSQAREASPTKTRSNAPRTLTLPKPWVNLDDMRGDETLPLRSFATPASEFMEEFERHAEKSNRRMDKYGGSRKAGKSNKKSSKRSGKFDEDTDMEEYSRWMEEEVEWHRQGENV